MKQTIKLTLIGLTALGLGGLAAADSISNLSEATSDSVEASARVIASGGQVALGAVAIPLALAGATSEGAGSAATTIADDLWKTANAPLKVDDDIAMAQPLPHVPRTPDADTQSEEQ